jgi:hypothetical protein
VGLGKLFAGPWNAPLLFAPDLAADYRKMSDDLLE